MRREGKERGERGGSELKVIMRVTKRRRANRYRVTVAIILTLGSDCLEPHDTGMLMLDCLEFNSRHELKDSCVSDELVRRSTREIKFNVDNCTNH